MLNTIIAGCFVVAIITAMIVLGGYSIFMLNKKKTPDRLTLKLSGGESNMSFTRIDVGNWHFAILKNRNPEEWQVFSEIFPVGHIVVEGFKMIVRMPNDAGHVIYTDDTSLPTSFDDQEKLPMLVSAIMSIRERLVQNTNN